MIGGEAIDHFQAQAQCLPIGILGFLFVIAPKFLEPLGDSAVAVMGIPVGFILLAMGGLSMFTGFILIRRIVDIEV